MLLEDRTREEDHLGKVREVSSHQHRGEHPVDQVETSYPAEGQEELMEPGAEERNLLVLVVAMHRVEHLEGHLGEDHTLVGLGAAVGVGNDLVAEAEHRTAVVWHPVVPIPEAGRVVHPGAERNLRAGLAAPVAVHRGVAAGMAERLGVHLGNSVVTWAPVVVLWLARSLALPEPQRLVGCYRSREVAGE